MGSKRRASSFNTTRIDHLYQDPHEHDPRLKLHYGDLSDGSNLQRIIEQVQPDEIYNLGAQSHVAVSFEGTKYTADVDALGTLRILEAVRIGGLANKTRVYQASTSELYGLVQEVPQRETTPFHPRALMGWRNFMPTGSPLTTERLTECMPATAFFSITNLRVRGETFVTRKNHTRPSTD